MSRFAITSATGSGPRRALLVAITIAGVALASQVVTRALAHHYAQTDPATALAWNSEDPDALLKLSDNYLAAPGYVKNPSAADALARRALRLAPLDAHAMRNLGLAAEARGRTDQAAAIMARAERRGYQDVATQAWLLRRDLSMAALDDGFLRIDALLRTKPELASRLLPAIAAVATLPIAIDPLARRLATNPPWRTEVLVYLDDVAKDIGPVLTLHERIATLGSPPTADEEAFLISRMVRDGRYEEGHRLWLNHLPPRERENPGLPYDGDFRGLEGAKPFNWRLFPAAGVTVELAKDGPSRTSGLFVQYPVGSPATLVEQLLVLPQGTYRFSARYKIAAPAAGARLKWTVRCVGVTDVRIEVRQAADFPTPWTALTGVFTVPADCPAQWLRLEGGAGDGFGDLAAWYSHLAIAPT